MVATEAADPTVGPIGGQAFVEGVMMRRGTAWGAAVRRPDGTIVTTSRRLPEPGVLRRIPLVRGVFALYDTTLLGYGNGGHDFGDKLPSDIFKKHSLACYISDPAALKCRYDVGIDNIAWECDYPHSDTVWPESADRLFETVRHLSDEQIDKITHRNALKRANFDAFGMMGGRENCTVAALRAQAVHVDTVPKSFGGPAPLADGEVERRVTSGDIVRMMTDVAQYDGRLDEVA